MRANARDQASVHLSELLCSGFVRQSRAVVGAVQGRGTFWHSNVCPAFRGHSGFQPGFEVT